MQNELIDLTEFDMKDEELFTFIDNSTINSEKITAPRYSYWKSVLRVFFKKKLNILFLAILVIILLLTYIYPVIVHYDLFENFGDDTLYHMRTAEAFSRFGFSIRWIFGTGEAGQSVWDQIWHGAQFSITLALICAAINMTVGVVVGAIWGFSKRVDVIMTEVFNIVGNVPGILLIGVLVMLLERTFMTLVFALTVTGWLGIAYFIRTQVIVIRDREYNLASRCLGTSIFRITIKNILPFMVSIIVTMLATEIPAYIGTEVFLSSSYVNLGVSSDSLGFLIAAKEQVMTTPGQQIEFWAPVAITSAITIILYIVGQNLGDASDPRTHM